ncbi:hypothetical protein GLOTRDRAFT_131144 [Gloeophyllum trabeum ATCC 11539]|uniref:Uncharacterized protein n=1 Tax=Gloeophyllum trabeum (strain ATCC 11539 / FP-39264 / Madison 617) TaxID=670483 RepID=S7Q2R4_GLOTA|nr:uncharacterized protein GLOTRDRAFT_131144 [Gloeophyllum trabeum ATCC 11539]EPQ53813.1 hypothetical protein GLOTRDRAFT_131144 [Gloeophyllum trabeum ATCC 11539]
MLQPLFSKTNGGYVPPPSSPIPNKYRPTSDKCKENEVKGRHASRGSVDNPEAPEPSFAPQGERLFFQKKRPSSTTKESPSEKIEPESEPLPRLSLARHVLLKSRLLDFNKKVARVMFRTWIASVLEKKRMGYREWRTYLQCHKALSAREDINKDTLPRRSIEKFRAMGVEPDDFNDEVWMPGAFEPPTQVIKLPFEERKERLVRKLVAAFLVGVEKRAEERERLEEQARLQEEEGSLEEEGETSSAGEEGNKVVDDAEDDAADGDGEVQNAEKAVGNNEPIHATKAVEDAADKPCRPDDSSHVPSPVRSDEGSDARPPVATTGASLPSSPSPVRSSPLCEIAHPSVVKPADDVPARSAEDIGVLTTEDAEGAAQDPSATPSATSERAPSSTPPPTASTSPQVKAKPSEQEQPLPAQNTQHQVYDTTYTEQGAEPLQPMAVRGPPADSFACLAVGMGRAPRDDFEREVYTEGLARAYAQILTRENLEHDFAERGIELPHIEDDGALKPRWDNVWALEHDAYQAVYANAFAEVLAQEALEEEEEEAEDSDDEERPVDRMDQDWKVQIRRTRRAVLEDVELADGSAMDISFHGPIDSMECEVADGPTGMAVPILAGLDGVEDEPMDVDLPLQSDDIDASMMSLAPFDFGTPADPVEDVLGAFGNIDLGPDDAIEVDTHLDW